MVALLRVLWFITTPFVFSSVISRLRPMIFRLRPQVTARRQNCVGPRAARSPKMGLMSFISSKLENIRKHKEFARRPERIILVRHGESEGNMDKERYSQTPDSKILLTQTGWAQAGAAGAQLQKLIGNETVRFFHSPYMRTQQTLLAMLKAFGGHSVEVSAEPRLREQDFGNFQNSTQMEETYLERQKFGRFYFRFPNGEAGTDVYDRMASFIAFLFRTMQSGESGYFAKYDGAPAKNYVIVTHGLLMRIFCMCYLRWSVEEFEQVWNPKNCEIWVLQKISGEGTYELSGRWRTSPHGGFFNDIRFGKDRNQPLYTHMKRPIVSRSLFPGASGALAPIALAHLRDAPGPETAPEGSKHQSTKDMETVIAYWRRSQEAQSPNW